MERVDRIGPSVYVTRDGLSILTRVEYDPPSDRDNCKHMIWLRLYRTMFCTSFANSWGTKSNLMSCLHVLAQVGVLLYLH